MNMQVPVPLGDAVACLRSAGLGLVLRPGELDRPIEALRAAAARQADAISPYHALPALFRAVASFDTPRPAATAALKTVAVRLYPRVWSGPGASASRLALIRAVRLVYAERLLATIRLTWSVRPSGRAEIMPEGMSYDEETDAILQAGARATAGGGTLQRFSRTPTRRMHEDPEGFALGACAVLAGDPPSAQRAFAGTYLAALPGASAARGYWAALTTRLLLLHTARQFAGQVHDDPRGIAILGPSGTGVYGPPARRMTRPDLYLLQREMAACSWDRGWLRDALADGEESHAFVERPACRITADRDLLVTSERNIADSITALTEMAVGPYSGKRRWAFPQSVFLRLVSRPFEEATVRLFREHGFTVGEVTDKGAWLTQEGPVTLPPGTLRPPGQVDLLAWHPSGYLLVGDCKILQLPRTVSTWTNLWKALHEDERGFLTKIDANARWAEGFLVATGRTVSRVALALILDQPLHLWQQDGGPVTVTHFTDLADKLTEGRIPGQ